MKTGKKTLFVPVLMIAVGIGWLLTTMGLVPEVNWVWTLGLAVAGLLTFVVSGFDKVSVTVGPFLLIASVLSVLRQTERIRIDQELPVLVIVAGILLLVARSPKVPVPQWFFENGKKG